MSAQSQSRPHRVERIGHRGAPRVHLENTIAAFDAAISLGADAVELDVHVTADGVPVVHHDPTLGRRVTPRDLRGRALRDLTVAELETVDLGDGTSPPTLAAVLNHIADRARVYVEIKAGAEARVAAVIAASPAECAVHSFDHAAIARMADLAHDIPRGILYENAPEDLYRDMIATRARDVWPSTGVVDAALVRAVHGAGGRVIVWTVNRRAEAARLIELGVDGLCTDDVSVLPDLP